MTRNGPAKSSGLAALRMTRGRRVIFSLGNIGGENHAD
jgi:hypothetical protein